MAYAVTADVRLMTNLTTSDIGDSDMTSLIGEATSQVNSDVLVKIVREFVSPIDSVRQNLIDGSNTIYYVRNWRGKFLGDLDNDGDVDTSDVIVHQIDTDGKTETELTINAIDDDDGKITLSSAPGSGVRLFITYSFGWVRALAGSVDPRLKLATTLLTAAYCYAKINFGRAPMSQYGSTRLTRHMESFNLYYQRYLDLIKQIQQLGGLSQSVENIHTF